MSNSRANKHPSSFRDIFQLGGLKLKKVLVLAKKMFRAGQTSTELKDTLCELGLAFYHQQKGKLPTSDSREIKSLINKVDYLEKLMESHEGEIQKLKFNSK